MYIGIGADVSGTIRTETCTCCCSNRSLEKDRVYSFVEFEGALETGIGLGITIKPFTEVLLKGPRIKKLVSVSAGVDCDRQVSIGRFKAGIEAILGGEAEVVVGGFGGRLSVSAVYSVNVELAIYTNRLTFEADKGSLEYQWEVFLVVSGLDVGYSGSESIYYNPSKEQVIAEW